MDTWITSIDRRRQRKCNEKGHDKPLFPLVVVLDEWIVPSKVEMFCYVFEPFGLEHNKSVPATMSTSSHGCFFPAIREYLKSNPLIDLSIALILSPCQFDTFMIKWGLSPELYRKYSSRALFAKSSKPHDLAKP